MTVFAPTILHNIFSLNNNRLLLFYQSIAVIHYIHVLLIFSRSVALIKGITKAREFQVIGGHLVCFLVCFLTGRADIFAEGGIFAGVLAPGVDVASVVPAALGEDHHVVEGVKGA